MRRLPRSIVAASLVGALVALISCSKSRPCSPCEVVGGTYQMTYSPSASTGLCGSNLPQPSALEIQQEEASLRTLVGGVQLSGTLYDSNDFSLAGIGTPVGAQGQTDGGLGAGSMQLQGYFVIDAEDAGTRLQGTFGYTAPGSECTAELAVSGTRI